jgi:protein ImuB
MSLVATRLAVLWLPHWSVAAAGCRHDEAMVVLHGNRVVACSRSATEQGVAVGMRRRQAQSRCPSAQIVDHDPGRDARQFEAVLSVVTAYAPRLEVVEPGLLTFAARGPARYFGGEQAMAARIHAAVTEHLGGRSAAAGGCGLGLADGRFAALLAARRAVADGHPLIVVPGHQTTIDFLAPMPVSTLQHGGVPGDVVALFPQLGIRRLGELAALPPTHLLARFGDAGAHAHALASGNGDRPPNAHDPPPGYTVRHLFDEPVAHVDTVVFAARRLVNDMVAGLADEGRMCTRLLVTAETEHGERSEREWYRPTGFSVAAMVERIRWQMDAWVSHLDPGEAATAGITLLRLEPTEVRSDGGVQLGLWGGRSQADDWAQRAVARLVSLSEGDCAQVFVPAGAGGRQPSDAYSWTSAATADLTDAQERLADIAGPWPGQLPRPSPAVVPARPVAIEVHDAAGHCVAVSGRGVVSAPPSSVTISGRRRRVERWAGPWPIDERWWDSARARRSARFQVLTDDGALFLVAVERQQWLLLAEYA